MRYKTNWLAALLCPMLVAFTASTAAVETKLSSSSFHTMFVDDGNLYGMGWNKFGAVMTGSAVVQQILTPQFTGVTDVKTVATNNYRTAVLKEDGTVLIWGQISGSTFAPAPYSPPATGVITDIAMTSTDLYYVIDGELFKWAYGTTIPTKISDSTQGRVASVAAGFTHVVVLYTDTTVGTFGGNKNGQLGTGDLLSNLVSVTRVPGLVGITTVVAGDYFSFATNNAGQVFGFGSNVNGQLGLGNTVANELRPVAIPGLENVKKIYAGRIQTIALTHSGTIKAAGYHDYIMGPLYTTDSSFVDVPNVIGVIDIAGGGDSNYVYRGVRGELHGWAGNSNGKLGDGTTTERHELVTAKWDPIIRISAEPVVVAKVAEVIPEPVVVVAEPVAEPVVEAAIMIPFAQPVTVTEPITEPTIVMSMVETTVAVVDTVVEAVVSTVQTVIDTCAEALGISDNRPTKKKCNNGFGNGDQCAPGKSLLHNNAENAQQAKWQSHKDASISKHVSASATKGKRN